MGFELVGKSYHVSNKAEMIEAEGGRKGEAFGKDRGFRGGEGMRGIDNRDNLGGVGVVSMDGGWWLVWGGWNG